MAIPKIQKDLKTKRQFIKIKNKKIFLDTLLKKVNAKRKEKKKRAYKKLTKRNLKSALALILFEKAEPKAVKLKKPRARKGRVGKAPKTRFEKGQEKQTLLKKQNIQLIKDVNQQAFNITVKKLAKEFTRNQLIDIIKKSDLVFLSDTKNLTENQLLTELLDKGEPDIVKRYNYHIRNKLTADSIYDKFSPSDVRLITTLPEKKVSNKQLNDNKKFDELQRIAEFGKEQEFPDQMDIINFDEEPSRWAKHKNIWDKEKNNLLKVVQSEKGDKRRVFNDLHNKLKDIFDDYDDYSSQQKSPPDSPKNETKKLRETKESKEDDFDELEKDIDELLENQEKMMKELEGGQKGGNDLEHLIAIRQELERDKDELFNELEDPDGYYDGNPDPADLGVIQDMNYIDGQLNTIDNQIENLRLETKRRTLQPLDPNVKQGRGNVESKPEIEGGMLTENEDALSNTQLEKMMNQYDNFLGVFPKDHMYKGLAMIKPKTKMGMIINLDKSDQGGSHWVAVYADPKSVEYYDSFGRQPPQDILKELKKIPRQMKGGEVPKLKINTRTTQNDNSVSCGYIASRFLMDRFRGKNFKKATGYSIKNSEDNAEDMKFKYMT